MRQLKPCLRKRQLKLRRILEEPLGDLAIAGIKLQRQIRLEHHRCVTHTLYMSIGDRACSSIALGLPLQCPSGAARLLPVVSKKIGQVHDRPLGRRSRPGAL